MIDVAVDLTGVYYLQDRNLNSLILHSKPSLICLQSTIVTSPFTRLGPFPIFSRIKREKDWDENSQRFIANKNLKMVCKLKMSAFSESYVAH